ncbi:unnamed protein product [Rotaria sordida]|uniref:Uncharacterized protein n=1 Tax=Rotaria sordida TaxID=392033 RepID=A0A818YY50_9BILA|nr:unnamed protein product [Rotaria sordida]CAF0885640.1 unnamed protein product [Rotaria sordida]CAF3762971.1 unnamed protein product [Rotaria sordida]CAF3772736.1 unnamed protein product [Rotaria sordida]
MIQILNNYFNGLIKIKLKYLVDLIEHMEEYPYFGVQHLLENQHSKYGSIRLIFPFSLIYSSTQHHLFNLGQRKNGSDIWQNILITTRKQIAGYENDFFELSSIPLDIAIDLTDGPLILSNVRITFVNHIHRCISILPDKLTPQHSYYNTSHSAMENFLRHLRKSEQSTLD